MTFSEKSRFLRKEKGLSQVELARALNISKACISMIEIGKNEPTAITLIRYADFFECSVDYLLGREDDFGNVIIQGNPAELSAEEAELLRIFKKLPADLQRRATAYMQNLGQLVDKESHFGEFRP